MSYSIEPLKDRDVEEAAALFKKTAMKIPYYTKKALLGYAAENTPTELRRKMKLKNHMMHVAKHNRKIIGLDFGHTEYGVGVSDWMLIDSAHRHKGVGMRLFSNFEKKCYSMGCHKLQLDDRTNNKEDVYFCLKRGFKIEGILKRHWFGQDYYLWSKYIR